MVERMCIVSREVRPEEELVRFVLSPDGDVVPDLRRKLPGRGVWVTVKRAAVAEALKRNMFARGFGVPAKAPADLAELVSKLLRAEAVASLSMARKAGEAVTGFVKVETALCKGPVRHLIHAPNAGVDGVKKLNKLVQPETLISQAFSADELNLAFGQTNVIHAAIAEGGLAEKLNVQLQRLRRYDEA
jgi:uncharacterized protein